jgi:hypothetical protein
LYRPGAAARSAVRLVYWFIFNPDGWNNLPASDAKFWAVRYGGLIGNDGLFRTADFNQLFVPPGPVIYQ